MKRNKKRNKTKQKTTNCEEDWGWLVQTERHPLHRSYSCKGISPTQITRAADSGNKEASEEKHLVKTEFFIKINSHHL